MHHAFSPPAADSRTRSAEHRDLFPPGKPWPIPSGKKSSSRTQRLFQEAGSSTPWHDYQLPPIVKALLPFLCLLASLLPAASKEREHKAFDEAMSQQFSLGLGKSYTFFHLADRAKRLQENQWIQVTGQHHGLLLQIDKDAKIEFPDGESWVDSPGGNRVPLLFKPMDARRLPGYWRACFSRPNPLVDGVHAYHVTLVIDGKKQTFEHQIQSNFEQAGPGVMSIRQEGGSPG